ncbi:hypothetical protein M3G03_12685 [Aestuariimicrobium sp. p3-SID1156]|uniref:hypothetical protein n=1 Tax=Aestuariimicrobium sp. p3-SID1156 TaxID=2916038 RepID=UPI00223AD76B|nr:hypothetical protein [Aestuariimicrobium sp. p3-SID1156]MCT1460383.1 hypothetical protein [Aestuariimicrobium sp. p3-SID1156]
MSIPPQSGPQQWGTPQYPPQPQFAPRAPKPSDGSGMRRAGKVLMAISAVLAVITVVCSVLSYNWLKEISALVDNSVQVRGGTATVTLNPGDRKAIWVPTGAAGRCEVAGPDGEPLTLGGTGSVTITANQDEYHRMGTFTATEAGNHTLTCSGDSDGILVGEDFDAGSVARGAFALMGAIGAGVTGGGLFLLGLILWLVGRSQRTR